MLICLIIGYDNFDISLRLCPPDFSTVRLPYFPLLLLGITIPGRGLEGPEAVH